MIVTVTPNTALDRVIFIDRFNRGFPARTNRWVDCLGGKALDTSVTLSCLGVPNIAMGFLAGQVGRDVIRIIENYGFFHDMVWINGETRLSHVIVEMDYHKHTHILLGDNIILPSQYEELLNRLRINLPTADYVVTGGSLPSGIPADFYKTITEVSHQSGKPILIDSRRDPILQALPAKPDIIKMNNDEFADTFDLASSSVDELAVSGRNVLQKNGLANFVITCGKDGILAIQENNTFLASGPRQDAVNAAGAGDAVSAALAWKLSEGESWEEALRWAAATSAASVLTEATAECRMEDVQRLLPEAVVKKL